MDGFEELDPEELEEKFDKAFPGDSVPLGESVVIEVELEGEEWGANYIGPAGHYKIFISRFNEIEITRE
jgi:hypothetical protein